VAHCAAFLLAQLWAHGARRFAERVAKIGLTAPDAGLLRKIASDPGVSQQALAEHLGVMPSRMVALVDELETKGIIERRRSTEDRRNYALQLTQRGNQLLGELSRVAARAIERFMPAYRRGARAYAGCASRVPSPGNKEIRRAMPGLDLEAQSAKRSGHPSYWCLDHGRLGISTKDPFQLPERCER
jgi:DNA-binding MarR family transcriptional regulator